MLSVNGVLIPDDTRVRDVAILDQSDWSCRDKCYCIFKVYNDLILVM